MLHCNFKETASWILRCLRQLVIGKHPCFSGRQNPRHCERSGGLTLLIKGLEVSHLTSQRP